MLPSKVVKNNNNKIKQGENKAILSFGWFFLLGE